MPMFPKTFRLMLRFIFSVVKILESFLDYGKKNTFVSKAKMVTSGLPVATENVQTTLRQSNVDRKIDFV